MPPSATRASPAGARTTPPFHADHVVRFLRPRFPLEGRERFQQGGIDRAALRAIEDDAIRGIVRSARPSQAGGPFSSTTVPSGSAT